MILRQDDDYRLAQDTQVRVYVKDGNGAWTKSSNKVTIHEGDYVITDPTAPTTEPKK